MKKLKRLLPLLFILVLEGCVTIKPFKACSVAGTLSAGAICASQPSGTTEDLDFGQFLDFLEAAPAQGNQPAKAAAICLSAVDFGNLKTELEQACRELGSTCSYEVHSFISQLDLLSKLNSK